MLVLAEIRTLAAGKLIRAGEGVARRVLTGPASKEAITREMPSRIVTGSLHGFPALAGASPRRVR